MITVFSYKNNEIFVKAPKHQHDGAVGDFTNFFLGNLCKSSKSSKSTKITVFSYKNGEIFVNAPKAPA